MKHRGRLRRQRIGALQGELKNGMVALEGGNPLPP
jgi:hypothetical protein